MNANSKPERFTTQRIFAAIIALPPTAFALLVLRHQFAAGFDSLGVIVGSGSCTIALICWWFALRGHIAADRARMRYAGIGGLIVGGIGFVAGFFGPIILVPNSIQGPLLGIFFTGPIGFVAGVVSGWIYGNFRPSTGMMDEARKQQNAFERSPRQPSDDSVEG